MGLTDAGQMTIALALESALAGDGVTVNLTAMLQNCQTSAQLTSQRTREVPIGATTRWSAKVIALARHGAGAMALQTAD